VRGWRKIPCHIADLSDVESYEISLIENLQRKTMNPIEEAKAFKLYIEHYGWGGVTDLATKLGKSQEYISRRLKLLELSEDIQKEIIRHRISSSIAEEIAYVKNRKEQSLLTNLIKKRHLTVRQLREITQNDRMDNEFLTRTKTHHDDSYLLVKCMTILKITIRRINDLNGDTKTNSLIVDEALRFQKDYLNLQIDQLIKIKKKYKNSLQ
jgi:ParB family chromosome partitioning protein